MRVKICGIRNLEEARLAVDCGAAALGFLVGLDYPTDDELDAAQAAAIIASLPPFVSSTFVTHSKALDWAADTCRRMGSTTIQLHGDFPLDQIPELRARLPHVRVIKAVHVVDSSAVERAIEAARWADAVLLDSKTATRIGGTGVVHDWSISARVVQAVTKPVILAGGLKPQNVAAAIAAVKPYAVDVNSGLEDAAGDKSPEKVAAFMSAVHEAAARLGACGAPNAALPRDRSR